MIKPRENSWDNVKVGPGAPPIRTPRGWLNVYHAVDASHTYRLGLALHGLDDPSIVLKRQNSGSSNPSWTGKNMAMWMVAIFTCGALLHNDFTLRVYYAGRTPSSGSLRAM